MRTNRIDWHSHHMMLAMVTAERSPDPNTQVGACIVDHQNRVLSLGYNGPPRGIEASQMPWAREGEPENTKYPYVVHAERNAILNAKRDLDGATLFVTLHPCNECAKEIVQTGIQEVHYLKNPYADRWETKTGKWILDTALVRLVQHKWNENTKSILSGLFKDVSL